MKDLVLWLSGAALAFFVTAGAFLLLANAGGGPPEKRLPRDPRLAESGPLLSLDLSRDRLQELRDRPDQTLSLVVRNEGDEGLSDVSLTLKVSSENTALSEARYYRTSVKRLAAEQSAIVGFTLDLSPLDRPGEGRPVSAVGPEPPRKIIEVRATTPEGVSAVRTAVLPS